MRKTGLGRFLLSATLAVAFATIMAGPAPAQIYGRFGPSCSGEPTDPDGTLLILEETETDLTVYGLAAEPRTEAEPESWFEILLDLLRSLGLLNGEEGSQ